MAEAETDSLKIVEPQKENDDNGVKRSIDGDGDGVKFKASLKRSIKKFNALIDEDGNSDVNQESENEHIVNRNYATMPQRCLKSDSEIE